MFLKKLATSIAIIGGLLLMGNQDAEASRFYDASTARWVEVGGNKSTTRRGSSIKKKVVDYKTKYRKGTIIVDTNERRLYFVMGNGKAMKYGVGVGRTGFQWAGRHRITNKREWPDWRPPAAMRKRVKGLPVVWKGGPDNPLGARALYIGSTLYRIHGTSEPWTIGHAVSSGCIRMTNDDVTDLYERARIGGLIVVKR